MNSATTQGQIQFIQNHQTALDAGEYQITVSQTVKIDGKAPQFDGKDEKPFETSLTFVIQGNRFGLHPQDIHAVFPPENSLGDHSNVLPHIALESSTLPWERLVHPDARQETPWLALLLIHDDEKLLRTIQKEDFIKSKLYDQQGKEITNVKKEELWKHLLSDDVLWLRSIENDEAIIVEKEARKSLQLSGEFAVFDSQVEALLAQFRDIKLVTLEKLKAPSQSTIKWPSVELDIGQKEKDQASVIDIPKKLLSQVLPSTQELEYLAHVRQTTGGSESGDPLSIVVGNRLPKQGGTSTAYLVSLENHCFIKAVEEKYRKQESLSQDVEGKNFESVNDEIKNFLRGKENTKIDKNQVNSLPAVKELLGKIKEETKEETKEALWNYLLSPEIHWLEAIFDDRNAQDEDYIRLVVLKSWSFSCSDPERSFKGLLKNLNLLFQTTLSDADKYELDQGTVPDNLKSEFRKHKPDLSENFLIAHNWSIKDGNRHYPISINSNNKNEKKLSIFYEGILVLPKPKHATLEAEQYLIKGYVPLRHYLRQGGNTFSWYHSPLLPGENKTNLGLSQFAVCCADQLIAYDEKNGLFDISYAAAWQLGQLLALQDKKLAINLFNWKRANAQKLAKDNQQALYPHLFSADSSNAGDSISLPEDIAIWFNQLALLSGVPFNYLVPDDKMLPPESIRFFWLDWFWVESLLDGAFSIGRVHESNPQLDNLPSQVKQITGCLIRSEVVAGWPDLQINASAFSIEKDQPMQDSQKLTLLRRDRLSQDVIICLFEGEIQTLDISLKPEGLHFGFNSGDDQLHRELRSLGGKEKSDWKITSIPWKNENQTIVNIDQLAEEIKKKLKEKGEILSSFTSAQFALQMVQGAELVRFHG